MLCTASLRRAQRRQSPIFLEVHTNSRRGNRDKLDNGKFFLEEFHEGGRTVAQGSREVLKSPSLQIIKTTLAKVPRYLLYWDLP